MFGLGFWKILLLVAVIAAVWFAARALERSRARPAVENRARRPGAPPDNSTVDLERNPATGAYEPRRSDDAVRAGDRRDRTP